jgi:hypothetical protein
VANANANSTVTGLGSEGRFTITAVDDVKDFVAGTRSVTLRIDHPGLIWTGGYPYSYSE